MINLYSRTVNKLFFFVSQNRWRDEQYSRLQNKEVGEMLLKKQQVKLTQSFT